VSEAFAFPTPEQVAEILAQMKAAERKKYPRIKTGDHRRDAIVQARIRLLQDAERLGDFFYEPPRPMSRDERWARLRWIPVQLAALQRYGLARRVPALDTDDLDARLRLRLQILDLEPARRPDEAGARVGSIYLIGTKEGPRRIKVGFSDRPPERLKSLQCGSPVELELLAFWQAISAVESALHDALLPHRVRLEWFHGDVAPVLRAVLDSIAKEVEP
jgi:hypothetical protein